MKKIIRIVLLVIFTVVMVLTTARISTVRALSSNGDDPHYKLKEKVKQAFRSEWEWDEDKQDYKDTDGLVRDPKTGLFPQPEPFPEALEGYAYWDGYLGLFIINSVEINHETGEVNENPLAGTISVTSDWPEYKFSSDDSFDSKYFEFKKIENEKYTRADGQEMYDDMYIIDKEGLTEEWFGLSITDLPMLLKKLEEGAPISYTMSLIMLITKADTGIVPFDGHPHLYINWVNSFNELTMNADTTVKEKGNDELGYLALPIINKQLKSKNDEMIKYLPEIAYGLYNNDRDSVKSWGSKEWLSWFEDNEKIMAALQYTLDNEISMEWLD